MFNSLKFQFYFKHLQDSSGRSLSDSFANFQEQLKAKGIPNSEWPFTFDQIKRNIDKCRYRRLDRFQRDFFDLFEKARQISKSGAQANFILLETCSAF